MPVTARFSAPVQTDPASCKVDNGSLSRGVKRPVRGVDHPPLPSAEVKKKRVEVFLYIHLKTWEQW